MDKDKINEKDNKGDDTMSAVATNYVYKVNARKEKPVPVMSKEELEAIKAAVSKYLKKK